jgi:hypothetical protein
MRRWTIVYYWRWFSSPMTQENDENIPPAAEQLSCCFLFFIAARPPILEMMVEMP